MAKECQGKKRYMTIERLAAEDLNVWAATHGNAHTRMLMLICVYAHTAFVFK